MNRRTKQLFFLTLLLAGFGGLPAGRVAAQTLATLHNFSATATNGLGNYTNSDGTTPFVSLFLSGGILYGTAAAGGTNGNGTIFAVNTNGTGFANLYVFTASPASAYPGIYTNNDGAAPEADLILSGGTLFGTATSGGTNGNGTVFKVSTNGSGFATLYQFKYTYGSLGAIGSNGDGAYPVDSLVLSGSTLYGTAAFGGTGGNGTVFALNTNGTGFSPLHQFSATVTNGLGIYTNSDGADPFGGLVLSGGILYGTASAGGRAGNGTIFAVGTGGAGFTNLYSFSATNASLLNNDGAAPQTGLILSGSTLFGVASYGGTNGNGTIFAISTNGSGFITLHDFSYVNGLLYTNSDGAVPVALMLSGGTLYGTTEYGGSAGNGAVFAVSTNGAGFTNLFSFTGSAGAAPWGVMKTGNFLYGTASAGGSAGNGTVFSLSFTPPLAILRAGTNVILTWPTNVAGFNYSGLNLQSTTNLTSPAVWNPAAPAPVFVNGNNVVTNAISGKQQFYRLSQ